MKSKPTFALAAVLLLYVPLLFAQNQPVQGPAQNQPAQTQPTNSGKPRTIDNLLNYLNMAGSATASNFHPQTQQERRNTYVKSMVNPFLFVKAGFSSGLDQWNDKPKEWEQGASGYGKRYGNILGQYVTQRTVTWGLSSALHEDNRYFNSGKKKFWPRTQYALLSGILARRDDGSRRFSFSLVGGTAAGAFLATTWLPPSQSSAGAAAVNFGISMGVNIGFSVVKEFLPDLGRALAKKRKKPTTTSQPSTADQH